MSVANLFKRKIRFSFIRDVPQETSMFHRRLQFYESPIIENVESVDATLFKLFVLYTFSKIVHESHDIPINFVLIKIGINDLQSYENLRLAVYRFKPQLASPKLFFTREELWPYRFPNSLLNQPFRVRVEVECCYIFSNQPQEIPSDESTDEEEDSPAPLIETYKQDHCVICLDRDPNILYLDCMHIAVCDSCDNLKINPALTENCDVCRTRISKRIKI